MPARSGSVFCSFSGKSSERIIRTCRGKGLTFGNVFPVLGQVALTRVLCRRYIHGDMNQNEWEYRRREPMSTGGIINLRPFLNQEWFERGGSTNISLALSFFSHTLPFMPLGSAFDLMPGDALPGFQDLLSPARFWLRCNSVMQHFRSILRHPLFPYCLALDRVERSKVVALHWETQVGEQGCADKHIIPCVEQGAHGLVMSHGGSSIGNVGRLAFHYDAVIANFATDRYPHSSQLSFIPNSFTGRVPDSAHLCLWNKASLSTS
jgi:hypothetical protein